MARDFVACRNLNCYILGRVPCHWGFIAMSDFLTPSKTLDLIGISLWRKRRGVDTELWFSFVVTHSAWMQWYLFSENSAYPGRLLDGQGFGAVEYIAGGPKHNYYRTTHLHLSRALRISELADNPANAGWVDANLFAVSGSQDSVFVTIEVQYRGGSGSLLRLQHFHLQGNYKLPAEIDGGRFRGRLTAPTQPELLNPNKLMNPPEGLAPG
jgi:hypothetical protein